MNDSLKNNYCNWLLNVTTIWLCSISYPILLTKYMSNQFIWCIRSTVSWSSNGKSWILRPSISLNVSLTYEVMEDNSRYIVNWWSWKFKSITSTPGGAVRDLFTDCEVAGSVCTKRRWCALLKSSKHNKTAVKYPSQFSAFNLTD